MQIKGNIPDYKVKQLRRDRLGIFSGTVEREYPVGAVNQRVDPLWLLDSPDPWGLPCVDADAQIQAPVCIVTYRYEGAAEGQTFAPDDDNTTFELDTSFAQQPIETHPAFQKLKSLYGWDSDERRFSEFLAATPTEGALPGNTSKGKPNPLFGEDSWLVLGVVFRKTYAARAFPTGLLSGIGTIVPRPPDIGQFKMPSSINKRNWLKAPPKVTRRGSAIQIAEEWILSGPRGWAKPVYSAEQLGGLA